MMPSRGSALRVTLIILAVAALALAGLYYLFIDPYSSRFLQFRFNDMVSAASVPSDLERATYLLTPANGAGVYRNGTLQFEEYERDGSFVVDIVYAGDHEFDLLFEPFSRLYVLTVDGATVYSSRTQLLNLFASEDGSRVAVAVRNEGSTFEVDPTSWKVVVVDVASNATWDVNGFAAAFVDVDTVLAFRSEGIVAVDFETGEERMAREFPTSLVYPSIAQSMDGSKIAWTTLDGDLYLYDVLQNSDITLAKLKELKTQQIRSRVALTNENLYEVVLYADGKTDILRHAIFSDETARIRSLPSTLSTTKLIP